MEKYACSCILVFVCTSHGHYLYDSLHTVAALQTFMASSSQHTLQQTRGEFHISLSSHLLHLLSQLFDEVLLPPQASAVSAALRMCLLFPAFAQPIKVDVTDMT